MLTMTADEADVFASEPERKKLIARLARVEGQLRGVQKLVASGKDCETVAQQLSAARGALDKAFFEMIACAFRSKFGKDLAPEAEDGLAEITRLLAKYA